MPLLKVEGKKKNKVVKSNQTELCFLNFMNEKKEHCRIPDTVIFPLLGIVITVPFESDLQVKLLASTVNWQLPAKRECENRG